MPCFMPITFLKHPVLLKNQGDNVRCKYVGPKNAVLVKNGFVKVHSCKSRLTPKNSAMVQNAKILHWLKGEKS